MIDILETDAFVSFTGDGFTTSYTVPFVFGDQEEIVVIFRTLATGAEVVASFGFDYAMTGGREVGITQWVSGTIEFVAAPPSTVLVWIGRRPPVRQGMYYNFWEIPEQSHERAFDHIALRDQELREEIRRAVLQPVGDNFALSPVRAPVLEIPDSVSRKEKYLGFTSDGSCEATTVTPVADPSVLMDPFVEAGDAEDATVIIKHASRASVVVNPAFRVDQPQGTYTTMADDAYAMDGWYHLTETTGKFDFTQQTTGPVGSSHYLEVKARDTSANRRWMVVQIVESSQIELLRDGFVLGVYLRSSDSTMNTIATQVWEWTGTANTVVSDLVATWNSGVQFPDEATNWVTTGGLAGGTTAPTTWQTTPILTAIPGGLSSSATNVAIVIGGYGAVTGSVTSGHKVDIGGITLVPTDQSNHFRQSLFEDEMFACQRFYQKTFPYATAPAIAGGINGALRTMGYGGAAPIDQWVFDHPLLPMVKAPTVTTYNPIAGDATARNVVNSANTAVTVSNITEKHILIKAATPVDVDQGDEMAIHALMDARL